MSREANSGSSAKKFPECVLNVAKSSMTVTDVGEADSQHQALPVIMALG